MKNSINEKQKMVRFLFLTILLSDVLDDISDQELPRRILKKTYSLNKDFDRIINYVFTSLPKKDSLEHSEIQLKFLKDFDKFYQDFLDKNNLIDG